LNRPRKKPLAHGVAVILDRHDGNRINPALATHSRRHMFFRSL
jgi:hypothetical protein